MQNTLHFNFRFLLPDQNFLLKPTADCHWVTSFAAKSPVLRSSLSFPHQTRCRNAITCARKNRTRSGSRRSREIILELVSFLVSNSKILPRPLDLVLSEFGGGDGGGLGFLKGFGGGGGFDGWRRKRKKRMLGIWVSFGLCILCFVLGMELSGRSLGVLGLCLIGANFIKGWKLGFKDWVFGFCCFGAVVSLGFKREHLMKRVENSRVCSAIVNTVKGSKRKGRRRFY
ncbi:uncharacterized protein LOC110815447 [Carica papaya]|uniref:uncharacterized protein LOC110815447 n=1 Tax=Carica papaya TaxID=3649 RepID=UPI000B8C99F4|nr:uncharacterized protein LOC110815447 [Carica papaya]